MAINLIKMIEGALGGELATQASKFLGESEANTKSALGGIFPALLSSLMQQGSTADGAGKLLSAITGPNVNANLLSNLGGLFAGGDKTSGLMSLGQSLLSGLLGNKLGSLTNVISQMSGIKPGSAGSLLSMAAPILFSFLKKYVGDNKMDARGFMSLLGDQGEYLRGSLDDKVTGALGLGSAGSFLSNAVDRLTDTADEVWDVMEGAGKSAYATATAAAKKVGDEAYELVDELDDEGSPAKKYLLWGLLGVGVLAALLAYRGCSSDVDEVATNATASSATQQAVDTAGEAAKDATAAAGAAVDTGAQATKTADATADAAKDAAAAAANAAEKAAGAAADAVKSIELPGGAKLEVTAGSPVEGLYNLVKDPASDISQALHLNGLNFETASAKITKDSMKIVEQVVAVLKAYPTTAIRVEGHTDNAGKADANKKLSTARAQSVKLALAKKGIASKRIDAQGYGQEKPIADNATEEGRAQNRRVDVVVTKR